MGHPPFVPPHTGLEGGQHLSMSPPIYPNDDERLERPLRSSMGAGKSAYNLTGVGLHCVTAPPPNPWSQHGIHVSHSLLRCASMTNLPTSSITRRLPNIKPTANLPPYTRTRTLPTAYRCNPQKAQPILDLVSTWSIQTHLGTSSPLCLCRHNRTLTRFGADSAMYRSLVTT